ncbi:MAG: hypothetical protein KH828_09365 [Clostridiales bacterium]|nr:hypothetical protein [Clostridiales bacterium]
MSNNSETYSRSTNIYVLKHKDLDVAMVQIHPASGEIEYILDIYLPEELPIGCGSDGTGVIEWWHDRAIPDSRRGIQQILNYLKEESSQSLMLSAYALSLTDHYWMQPINKELYWKDLNFYENNFSDELGSLLTDSQRIDMDAHVSKFSPSSSVNGEMKKKWVIIDGIRYLLKVNANHYGQQSVNELIAGQLHELLGWDNYVPYKMGKILMEEKEYPCSLNPLFTSAEMEFVSAYQLIRNYKTPNDMSNFEAIIQQAVSLGIDGEETRRQLEYTILTDFILTNTDRHFNNFGFLLDSGTHKLVSMAPIFDTGNALFFDKEIIPSKSNLLDVPVASFCKREVEMLRYVRLPLRFDTGKLSGFSEKAESLLMEYTDMPHERASKIAETIRQKIKYLDLFLCGKKIWKKEKYW